MYIISFPISERNLKSISLFLNLFTRSSDNSSQKLITRVEGKNVNKERGEKKVKRGLPFAERAYNSLWKEDEGKRRRKENRRWKKGYQPDT